MKKIFTLLLFGCAALPSLGQVSLKNGTYVQGASQTKLVVNNLSLLTDSATVDLSLADLFITGNSPITLGGNGPITLKSLTIDKPANPVLLAGQFSVNEKVELLSGKIDLNGQLLILGPSAVVVGENMQNNITGMNGGGVQITLSLNAPVQSNPGNLGLQFTTSANMGLTTITRTNNVLPGLSNAIKRSYEILPANNTGLNAILRFNYYDNELNGLNEANLGFYERTGPSTWNYLAATSRDTILNFVSRAGINSFSTYTLGEQVILPAVVWDTLTINCKGRDIEIGWSTSYESNLSNFTVQRTTDGVNWTSLGNVKPKNLPTGFSYKYVDRKPVSGSVYRIMASTKNKLQYYSGTIAGIICGGTNSNQSISTVETQPSEVDLIEARVYPVPTNDKVTVEVHSARAYSSNLSLFSSNGHVYQRKTQALHPGVNLISVDLGNLPAGIYYLQLFLPDKQPKTFMLIKQ